MNFQTVSTAEKLPESDGLKGGYDADGTTPAPLLRRALDYINTKVGSMLAALHAKGLAGLDHDDPLGQARPVPGHAVGADPDPRRADHRRARRSLGHRPSGRRRTAGRLLDRRRRDAALAPLPHAGSAAFAKSYLLAHNGTGNDIEGNPKAYTSSGLKTLYAGEEAADYFGASTTDPRVPDLFGIAQYGVVYTGGKGKIAEHGGANPQDRDVPLVVSGGPVDQHAVDTQTVETTQIAPTILSLLGLDPGALEAVEIEGTETLEIH